MWSTKTSELMTPKEKAKELVENYDETLTYLESKSKAKQCALIAVNEMLLEHFADTSEYADRRYNYLIKVKQEILLDDIFNEEKKKGVKELIDKHKQERSYSEEEVIAFGEFIFKHSLLTHTRGVKSLFEQFKNK